jgi:hypothetical protein
LFNLFDLDVAICCNSCPFDADAILFVYCHQNLIIMMHLLLRYFMGHMCYNIVQKGWIEDMLSTTSNDTCMCLALDESLL